MRRTRMIKGKGEGRRLCKDIRELRRSFRIQRDNIIRVC